MSNYRLKKIILAFFLHFPDRLHPVYLMLLCQKEGSIFGSATVSCTKKEYSIIDCYLMDETGSGGRYTGCSDLTCCILQAPFPLKCRIFLSHTGQQTVLTDRNFFCSNRDRLFHRYATRLVRSSGWLVPTPPPPRCRSGNDGHEHPLLTAAPQVPQKPQAPPCTFRPLANISFNAGSKSIFPPAL